MPIDPQIPLAAQPPHALDPMAALQTVFAIRAAQQEQGMRDLQMQELQQKRTDLQALDSAFAQPGGRDAVLNALPGHLRPVVNKQFIDMDKAHADYTEAQGKADEAKRNIYGTAAAVVKAHGYDPVAAQGMLSDLKLKFQNDPTELQNLQQFEQQLHANPTKEFVQQQIDPILAASPKQAELESARVTAESRALTAQTGAARFQAEQPLRAAQTAEAQARVPLVQAQVGEAKARLPLIAAQTREAQAAATKSGLEAQQLQAVSGAMGAAGKVPDVAAGQKNDAFLQTLPPAIAAQVKALAEGRMQFPSGFALRSPYWQGLIQAVAKYDPAFDTINYNARAKTRSDFTSGKAAQQVNAINTVIGHLDNLSQAADALHNSNYPLFNQMANVISKATGSPKVTNFNTVKKAVADEVTRVWRQAGGSETDIQQAQSNLDAAGSPSQLREGIATYGELLSSKLQALQSQYQQGMGTSDVQMITPQSLETLNRLMQKAGKPTIEAPSTTTAAPKVGERRMINGQLGEWDGKGWKPAR